MGFEGVTCTMELYLWVLNLELGTSISCHQTMRDQKADILMIVNFHLIILLFEINDFTEIASSLFNMNYLNCLILLLICNY